MDVLRLYKGIQRFRDRRTRYVFLAEENGDQLQKFWELEAIGIQDRTEEIENAELFDQFHKTLQNVNNRYQVGWPWKSSKYELPDNYKLAEARLKSLVNNFQKDKESMTKYDEIL